MYVDPTQPCAAAKMKAPISKKIKDVIGRAAGKARIRGRDVSSKLVLVAFHRVKSIFPEGGLTYSSARFEKFGFRNRI